MPKIKQDGEETSIEHSGSLSGMGRVAFVKQGTDAGFNFFSKEVLKERDGKLILKNKFSDSLDDLTVVETVSTTFTN